MEADLRGANLCKASLMEADLSHSSLSGVKALDSNFNKAIFTGACLEDWQINRATNLEQIICQYCYLSSEPRKRYPPDPKKYFLPGEFSQLFQKTTETVELIFSNSIDWHIFLSSFLELQVETGHGELSIQGIEKQSDRALVIRLEISAKGKGLEIEQSFWQKYKTLLKAKDSQKVGYSQVIDSTIQENTKLLKIIEAIAEKDKTLQSI